MSLLSLLVLGLYVNGLAMLMRGPDPSWTRQKTVREFLVMLFVMGFSGWYLLTYGLR